MRASVKTTAQEQPVPPVELEAYLRALGKRIAKAREVAGFSQEELAKRLNRVSQTISHYETGRNLPPTEVFLELEEVLGVDLHWLMTGKRFETVVQAVVKVLAVEKTL